MPIIDYAPNFKTEDFECHCKRCAKLYARTPDAAPRTKPDIIAAVQRLRDMLDEPLNISRGVSCEAHNAEIGGARDSRHLPQHADAIDIACANSQKAYRIVWQAMEMKEFKVIRVYKMHIHLDMRPGPFLFLASPE